MNCRQARDRWHEAFDAGLAPGEAFDAHLQSCDACREYAAEMSVLVGALDELHDATERVAVPTHPAVVAGGRARRPARWRVVVLASMRAAAVVVVLIGAGLYLSSGRNDVPDERLTQPQTKAARRVTLELRGQSQDELLAVHEDTAVGNEPVDVIWLYRLPARDLGGEESPRSSTEGTNQEKRT